MSLRIPVGSPVAGSLTISPPGGTGVVLVTPASLRARLLARIMCPSRRLTQTGLSGVTASIQSLRGSSTGVNCWWSQSPLRTQRPGPSSRALAAMRATKSSRLCRLAELDALQGEPAGQEMGVAVDETGQDERAAEVDELRPGGRQGPQLRRRPDREDLAVADGHGLGPRPGRVARPDFPVDQNQVDHVPLRGRLAARREPERQDDRQYTANVRSLSFLRNLL